MDLAVQNDTGSEKKRKCVTNQARVSCENGPMTTHCSVTLRHDQRVPSQISNNHNLFYLSYSFQSSAMLTYTLESVYERVLAL